MEASRRTGGWSRPVEDVGGTASRQAGGDGGGGVAMIWWRGLSSSSPRPHRAGGDGGGGAEPEPEPGGAVLSFRPSLVIAGPVVMETDLVLILLKVWDHGTKGGASGWRGQRRPGGRWRAFRKS
jgi:hypothetical protein